MHRILVFAAVLAALALLAPWARAQDAAPEPILAGKVTRLQGQAFALRGRDRLPLFEDDSVFVGDALSTGIETRLELELKDGTMLTLSDDTGFRIDALEHTPGAFGGRALLDLAKGAFRAVTGRITQTENPDFTVRTPLAEIGIRGTDFWGGFLAPDALDVFLLSGGDVAVRNARGVTVLAEPGQGTTVSSADEAPGQVKVWPQDKVDRAMATVAFND
ncbi:FecR family protein [Desulfocurvus sp. DL9XJH121]